MLVNFILCVIALVIIIILLKKLKAPNIDKIVLPDCKFVVTKPIFKIDLPIRIVNYRVLTKTKHRYFRDFPLGFKFFSDTPFRSKIKITYTVLGDDDIEIIYDKVVEFEDYVKEHIYYINDVIMGSIDIEIYTESDYGKPTIDFEILQNNMCHMSKEHKYTIEFPE